MQLSIAGWKRYIILGYFLAPLLSPAEAIGTYKYCCHIAKCRKIIESCQQEQTQVNGSTCEQYCLSNFECTPYDKLSVRDYTCFEPFLNNTLNSPLKFICGQAYQEGLAPAPKIEIDYNFCSKECTGWRLSRVGKPSEWAVPMLQYILPAVIFSMTIPRRHKLEVPDKLFDYEFDKWTNLVRLCISVVLAGIIVAVDTVTWVFVIFSGAGPMLVGGLHEAFLDRRIVVHLNILQFNSSRHSETLTLSDADKAELLLCVISGNLDSNIGSPETQLKSAIGLGLLGTVPRTHEQISRSLTSLLSMMASQTSFGSVVGAPVLFYLGAFIYGVTGLETNKGDNDTSHALAFGMWWMVIVHVAIVSGCLLASNNPSTAIAVVAQEMADTDGNAVAGTHRPSLARRLGIVPIYDTPFQPVPMWDRGCMKTVWVKKTNVWKRPDTAWFRNIIELKPMAYFWIGFAAWLLVIAPAVLAFVVSYFTPRVCVSCRSLTFLLYASCQTILIIIATMRAYFYEDSGANIEDIFAEISATLNRLRGKGSFVRFVGILCFLLTSIVTSLAIGGSVFTGFVSTLIQIIGGFRNCKCSVPATLWLSDHGNDKFNVASDTQELRDSSAYWSATGIAAITFMAVVCYAGWWYQKYLRGRFVERVMELVP